MVEARYGEVSSRYRDLILPPSDGVNGRPLLVNPQKPLQITCCRLIGLMVLMESHYKRLKNASRSRYIQIPLTPLTSLTLEGVR